MNKFSSFLVAGLVFCSTLINTVFADAVAGERTMNGLPQITLSDLQGAQHSLNEWHDKVIILNFWATWCGPCQVEIPYLIKYQLDYGDAGLQVIGIGLDVQRKLKNFVRTVGINYPVLHADPQRDSHLLQDWGDTIGVLPYTVVINKQGQLVYHQIGIFNDSAFNTYVKPLLIDDQALSIPAGNSPAAHLDKQAFSLQ